MSETVKKIVITVTVDTDGIHYRLEGFAAPSDVIYALERLKTQLINAEIAKSNPRPNVPGMLKGDLSRVRAP